MGNRKHPIKISGVPEPFNTPFSIADERHLFSDDLIVDFKHERCGSGALISQLKDGSVDAIVALTECIIAAQVEKDSNLEILCGHVNSPLLWGITVSASDQRFTTLSDLDEFVLKGNRVRVGISRHGSGSHIMSYILAHSRGWAELRDVNDILEFVVCCNFASLRASVRDSKCDFFLWEKFITRPYTMIPQERIRMLGHLPTPWPPFVVAVLRNGKHNEHVARVMDSIRRACHMFVSERVASIDRICHEFSMRSEDATEWMDHVRFATDGQPLSQDIYDKIRNALLSANALASKVTTS